MSTAVVKADDDADIGVVQALQVCETVRYKFKSNSISLQETVQVIYFWVTGKDRRAYKAEVAAYQSCFHGSC